MISISHKASEVLKDKLVRDCANAGMGFRVILAERQGGKTVYSLQLSQTLEGDLISEANGVRVFISTAVESQIGERELDVDQDNEGRLFFRKQNDTTRV